MHVVAIHSTSPCDGSRAPALASVLGSAVAEVRHRVVSPGPCVVAVFARPADAQGLAGRLEDAGFRALVRDARAVNGAALWVSGRSFQLHPEGISVSPRGAAPLSIRWTALHLIIRGTAMTDTTSTETVTRKTFSLGRAAVTGGLVRNTSVKAQHFRVEQTRQGFLHVYARGHSVVTFDETSVDYRGLGARLEPTRTANFLALVEVLRAAAPQATYDERLLSRSGQSAVLGPRVDAGANLRLASALIAGSLARGA